MNYYRDSSEEVSNRRSSTGRVRRTNSVLSCESTEIDANTAVSRSVLQSEWAEMVSLQLLYKYSPIIFMFTTRVVFLSPCLFLNTQTFLIHDYHEVSFVSRLSFPWVTSSFSCKPEAFIAVLEALLPFFFVCLWLSVCLLENSSWRAWAPQGTLTVNNRTYLARMT